MDSKITFREQWRTWLKTCFARYHGSPDWHILEECQPADARTSFGNDDRPERVVIVLHPPYSQAAAYFSSSSVDRTLDFADSELIKPDLSLDRTVTMTKRQRRMIEREVKDLDTKDAAIRCALTGTIPVLKKLLMVISPIFLSTFHVVI